MTTLLTVSVRDQAFADRDAERFESQPKQRDREPEHRMRHLSDRPARHTKEGSK